jgi:hypothetical protein
MRDDEGSALLEAAAELWANGSLGWGSTEVRHVPFSAECSFRLGASPERRRHVIGVAANALGPDPFASLDGLVGCLRPPRPVRAALQQLRDGGQLPSVVLIGLAESPSGPTARVYLEQRPIEGLLLGGPRASVNAAVSYEWATQSPDELFVRSYAELAADAVDDALAQAIPRSRYPELPAALTALRSRLRARWAYERADRARADGASAIQLILEHVRVREIADEVEQLAAALGAEAGLARRWCADVPDGVARVVGLGSTREGEAHLTLYHGLAEELSEPEDAHDA